MADFPAMPLWTDAWVADTHHLTRLQRGTYHDLLVLMWRTPGCRVPNDDRWLAARLGMTAEEVAGELRPLIAEFCRVDGNWITQKRLAREQAWVRARSEAQSVRAKQRWQKEKDICQGNTIRGTTPTPTPLLSEPNGSASRGRAASQRATRWEATAVVPEAWITQADMARERNGLPAIDLRLEAERFANYWASKSGAQATKIDWKRTWVNWALNAKGELHGRGQKRSAHETFFAAAGAVVAKLTGDDRQASGDAESNSPDEAGRALPSS